MKTPSLATVLIALTLVSASAQRSAGPPTAPSGKPPDTVFLEDLTWAEMRDLIKAGTTTVIIGTAGTEQKGPHMVDGEHKFVMEYTADKIARALGKTVVAPVVTYVPEGSWENPGGHMTKPGTITLPDDRFVELLVNAGRSLKAGGFTTILFLGESGGNRTGMRTRHAKLNELWKRRGAAFWIDDYYTKSHADQNAYVTRRSECRRTDRRPRNILDTSELMFVNAKHVRPSRFAPGGGYENSGVSGDRRSPRLRSARCSSDQDRQRARADQGDDVRLDATRVRSAAVPAAGVEAAADAAAVAATRRRRRAGATARPRGVRASKRAREHARRRRPTRSSSTSCTWEETRDAMKAGKTTVIVPTGGTEKNGYHMVLGKHNYVVTYAAQLMARRLKNALVAPTIQYVPEGDPDKQNPGAISLPSPAYDMLLDAPRAACRSHGFNEILFIGDSGGNQAGLLPSPTS
jgi:creatinine amidohydrolase/Fe(II)-dependent formamide hydrolase-like protein